MNTFGDEQLAVDLLADKLLFEALKYSVRFWLLSLVNPLLCSFAAFYALLTRTAGPVMAGSSAFLQRRTYKSAGVLTLAKATPGQNAVRCRGGLLEQESHIHVCITLIHGGWQSLMTVCRAR